MPRSFVDQGNLWLLSLPSSSFCSSFYCASLLIPLVLPSLILLLWLEEGMFISFTSNWYSFWEALDIIGALLFFSTVFTSAPFTTLSEVMINQINFSILHKCHLWVSSCTITTSLMASLFFFLSYWCMLMAVRASILFCIYSKIISAIHLSKAS